MCPKDGANWILYCKVLGVVWQVFVCSGGAVLNFDFHCHSTVSDGTLSPSELAVRAASRGVQCWALTDHDDLSGLAEAREAAVSAKLAFVTGVEISIEWQKASVHLVGLGVNPEADGLLQGLRDIREGRVVRARKMAESLARSGIGDAFAGAMRYAGNPDLISRAHFARFLVEQGMGSTVGKVFDHYLVPGKPGYVDHVWPSLESAVAWIRDAGGVAVVAHPGRYKSLSGGAMKRFLEAFKEAGGMGVEVVCGSHTQNHVLHFARLVRHFGFYASRGSDFHGPEESHCDLGGLPSLPEDLKPVWRLLN